MRRFLATLLLALSLPAHAHHSDEAMAKQIVRAYFAAIERKDPVLLKAITWPDGTPDASKCREGREPCRRFHELGGNYFGGYGLNYRSRFNSIEIIHTRNAYRFKVDYVSRQYRDQTIPTGQWCEKTAIFLVTERKGQWRLMEIQSQSSRCHEPQIGNEP